MCVYVCAFNLDRDSGVVCFEEWSLCFVFSREGLCLDGVYLKGVIWFKVLWVFVCVFS